MWPSQNGQFLFQIDACKWTFSLWIHQSRNSTLPCYLQSKSNDYFECQLANAPHQILIWEVQTQTGIDIFNVIFQTFVILIFRCFLKQLQPSQNGQFLFQIDACKWTFSLWIHQSRNSTLPCYLQSNSNDYFDCQLANAPHLILIWEVQTQTCFDIFNVIFQLLWFLSFVVF
jgi:hypothetical protein